MTGPAKCAVDGCNQPVDEAPAIRRATYERGPDTVHAWYDAHEKLRKAELWHDGGLVGTTTHLATLMDWLEA